MKYAVVHVDFDTFMLQNPTKHFQQKRYDAVDIAFGDSGPTDTCRNTGLIFMQDNANGHTMQSLLKTLQYLFGNPFAVDQQVLPRM